MKKILVVDNHPVMLSFMSNLLGKQGHNVLTAQDGISALNILESYRPDIIFVDIIMPNINGEKLCKIIRSKPEMKHIYIIVLSAIAGDQRLDLDEYGINAVIAKGPIDKMTKHILYALEQADIYWQKGKTDQAVIGLEGISRREITGELLSLNRHLESLLNNMSEGIFELDREHRIVYVNSTAASISGIPEERLLSLPFPELFAKSHQGDIQALISDGAGDSQDSYGYDTPITLNGKRILLNVLRAREGEESSLTIIMNDITERKRMEKQLMQAQRMESIATLAGGIAHQYNNALSVITGNIELIKMNNLESEFTEYLTPINQSAHRMTHLTSQLLAYARGGKYNPKNMSLTNFLKGTIPLIRHSIDPGIEMEIVLAKDLYHTRADHTQIQMVVSGVVTNAAEAITGHGRIRIIACNEVIPDSHPYLKSGPYACLKIEDDGIGMDEETKSRIFEPFFTTNFQGRGLGMAAAYGIVQNHGGWISVESELGKGTQVTIYLPAVDAAVGDKKEKAVKFEKRSGVILIIDDEKMIMEVCRAMLEKLGYTVLEAETGEEAIEIAKNFKGNIDIAILDIGLPDMGGEKLYPILKAAREDLKVIVCSGYAIDGPAQEILDAGAEGFIQKPYAFGTLAEKLEEAIAI